MKINQMRKHFQPYDEPKRRESAMARIKSRLSVMLSLFFSRLADSGPGRFCIEHKIHIAFGLNLLWIIGCIYWIYRILIIDVQPVREPWIALRDPRDALVILFFGIIGLLFLLFLTFFIIKLVCNLFREGLESIFPVQWHALVKPAGYLLMLYFAFSFTGTIKMAGLTTYLQVADLVNMSRNQSVIIEKKIPDDLERKLGDLMKLIDSDEQK